MGKFGLRRPVDLTSIDEIRTGQSTENFQRHPGIFFIIHPLTKRRRHNSPFT